MNRFDDSTRRRLATGWEPRVQTLREYARSVGASERAIRNWRARFLGVEQLAVPAGTGPVPLQAAVVALKARLVELDAAVDAARAAAEGCRQALDAVAGSQALGPEGVGDLAEEQQGGRQAPAADTAALPPAPEPEPTRPVPMPGPGFISW